MTKVLVVNMIPNNWSDEQNQDCEPCISVNPANPDEIIATAFTFDNPAGTSAISPAMTGSWAPIFYSNDGGISWSLHFVLPSGAGAVLPTFDVTARFGASGANVYSGLISSVSGSIIINRAANALTHQTTLVTRSGDQPFAETFFNGGQDLLYVGYNGSTTHATIDQSLDAGAGVPTFNAISVDLRNGSNGPKTRTAIHSSGTVYGAFYSANPDGTWDVVVVKDTNWGASLPPYQALIGGDGNAGVVVAPSISVGPSGTEDANFGHDRRGWELAIAVDPNDDKRVYLVYNTGTSATDYTLHLVRSTDGGATWSADARSIVVAKNPGVAINSLGHVGFAYQQVVGPVGSSNWVTIFEHSHDDFTTFDSHTLASTPSSVPTPASSMATYIGDYIKVQAAGESFYGVFSAANPPVAANFPSGIHFQRNVDMAAGHLLGNDGVTVVPPSIDPFFFKVTVTSGGVATAIADSGNFGQVCLGSFHDELLSIDNNGPGLLTITKIVSSSPEFEPPSVVSYPLLVSSGGWIGVMLRFRPASFGLKAAVITIFSDDPAGPHKIRVSGNCAPPRLSLILADSGNFGKVCVGAFKDEPLILNNSGKCTLTVTGIASTSSEFLAPAVVSFPLSVGPGDALPVPIRFEPTSFGPKSAVITVFSNDPAGPRKVRVTGDAPSGKLTITGSSIFGGVPNCRREQRILTLCNTGDCNLHVSHVGFKHKCKCYRLINNPFPAVLRPGSCLNLVIQYFANERVARGCELVIHSDDPGQPVRTIEVVAYTLWDCCNCGCKDHKQGCGCCECCDDEEEDRE
jgi:hypothetical protein